MKVTVIIPAFGDTPHLAACRKALAAQTFRDFEIVECAPAAGGLLNAGAARNAGLAKAQGEWIAFVDADDLPQPAMLAEAVAKGDAEDADIVIFGAEEFDDKTGWITLLPLKLDAGIADDARFVSFGNMVWNKLFRANYLREHGIRFQEIARSNDLAFTTEALARTDKIALVSKPLYRYRINAGGLQSTKSSSPNCWREALAECKARLERSGILQRFANAYAALEAQVAGDNLAGGRFSPRRILHSIRRRGFVNFLKHALGRLAK